MLQEHNMKSEHGLHVQVMCRVIVGHRPTLRRTEQTLSTEAFAYRIVIDGAVNGGRHVKAVVTLLNRFRQCSVAKA